MIILLAIYLTLATLDAAYTTRMLSLYGTGIELNPVIPFLARHTSVQTGTWLGIMLPTLLLGAVGVVLPVLFLILLPLRSVLCGMQLARLKVKWPFLRKTVLS